VRRPTVWRGYSGRGRGGQVRARGASRGDALREVVAAAARGDLREHPGHRLRCQAASREETAANLIRPQLQVVASGAVEKRDGWSGQVAAVEEVPELVAQGSRKLIVVEEIDQGPRHADTPVGPRPGPEPRSRRQAPVDLCVRKERLPDSRYALEPGRVERLGHVGSRRRPAAAGADNTD